MFRIPLVSSVTSHTSTELKYLNYEALVCCNIKLMGNKNLYHNTKISGADSWSQVVSTSQAHTAAIFILKIQKVE
jgi:L-cysteine desulfidase